MADPGVCTYASLRAPEAFQTLTRRAVFSCLGDPTTAPLDAWIRQVELCPTSKEKGDHFEALSVAYLLHPAGGGAAGIVQAWTLTDLPEAVQAAVGLSTRDLGIDIVALDARGEFHAVQSKFKKRSGRRRPGRRAPRVTWRELATFYALAHRGPYKKHWVFTTADGVSRVGGVREQDRSVCYKGLKAMPLEFWHDVAQIGGQRLAPGQAVPPSLEEVRAIRLARFEPKGDCSGDSDDGDCGDGGAKSVAPDFDSIWTAYGF